MPSLITHNFFGRQVYEELYQSIGGSKDQSDAFLIGNQGPDPLFYARVNPLFKNCAKLGSWMHSKNTDSLLAHLKGSLEALEPSELAIGRAFALGFLCHYALDSTMHPFVYAQEYELCDAGVEGLSRKQGTEVHFLIEAELDELVLFQKTGLTVRDYSPSLETLHASPRVLHIASKMVVHLAKEVYDLEAPRNLYATSMQTMRLAQHALRSKSGLKRSLIGGIERRISNRCRAQAISHLAIERSDSSFANQDNLPWTDPFTKQVRTEGFWDLYDVAQAKAFEMIETFDSAEFDFDQAHDLTQGRNFSGKVPASN